MIRLLPVLLALVLAGCGGDDEQAAQPVPADSIEVRVTHAGDGNGVYRCGGRCDVHRFGAVLKQARDKVRACTEIYGGPETAHVTGMLNGRRIDVSVTRNDGCGIADYEAVFAALGREPPIAPS